jgi:MinD-like ATPase involved in chromosome partitioning or flagellar assembly
MLGHVLAFARGDRVLALDANPDAGSLGHRVRQESALSVNDLLRHPRVVDSYVEMRTFTSQAASRLEVLASDQDPLLSERLGYEDYARVLGVLRLHYGIVLCDTCTGVLDASTGGILAMADQVVICTMGAVDAHRAVLRTLDWLEQHGHEGLARGAVVVVNAVRPGGTVDVGAMEAELAQRSRAVVRVPWDEKLSAGAETPFDELHEATQRAYVRIAAAVVDGFDEPGSGEGPATPRALPPHSVLGPRGTELEVEVVPWRGGTALLGRDVAGGIDYAIEFPQVVRGGQDAEGRWLLVHRTGTLETAARLARLPGGLLVLDAPGIARNGIAGDGSAIHIVDAMAGPRPVRVLLSRDPARVLGVDVGDRTTDRPSGFLGDHITIPGLIDHGHNATGDRIEVIDTDLHLAPAVTITDDHGVPVAIDLPTTPNTQH